LRRPENFRDYPSSNSKRKLLYIVYGKWLCKPPRTISTFIWITEKAMSALQEKLENTITEYKLLRQGAGFGTTRHKDDLCAKSVAFIVYGLLSEIETMYSLLIRKGTSLPRVYNKIGRLVFTSSSGKILKDEDIVSKFSNSSIDKGQQISEIIRHLIQNENYIVYGKWLCKPRENKTEKCEPIEKLFSQDKLKKYQVQPPRKLYNEFNKTCKKCHEQRFISSFRLYTQRAVKKEETCKVEIFLHLEWNKHYKVFGSWKCPNCEKRWTSAHTWISLQKYIDDSKELKKDDYYMQKCSGKQCRNLNTSIITNFEPLKRSDFVDKNPHREDLCAKCIAGHWCVKG
ncbi:12079_t:CDS:10, partial [Ambispora leptoticha]